MDYSLLFAVENNAQKALDKITIKTRKYSDIINEDQKQDLSSDGWDQFKFG